MCVFFDFFKPTSRFLNIFSYFFHPNNQGVTMKIEMIFYALKKSGTKPAYTISTNKQLGG